MNERIRKLLNEATSGLEPDISPQRTVTLNEMEKFAQLIVAECARVIVNGGYWSGGLLGPKRQCTPPEIATMIKQHFGVEE